nr:trypsin-like serine protease [Vibrio sp. S9_S30]
MFFFKDYNPFTLIPNIALIKLKTKADDKYTPAKIPTPQVERALASVGDTLRVSGWGSSETGRFLPTLRSSTVPVISLQECHEKWVKEFNIEHEYDKAYYERFICTDESASSSCVSDSGGPLIGSIGNTNFLFGIGAKTCDSVSLYTKYTRYNAWISHVTGLKPTDL